MEEERAAVHLDRPRKKAAEVIDVSGEEKSREKEKRGGQSKHRKRGRAAEELFPSSDKFKTDENVVNKT